MASTHDHDRAFDTRGDVSRLAPRALPGGYAVNATQTQGR